MTMKKPNLLDAARRGTLSSAANVKDRFDFGNAQDVIFGKPAEEVATQPQEPIAHKTVLKAEKKPKPKGKPGRKAVEKTIRDIFSMPESDYKLVAGLVERGGKLGMMINKSQVVRLGLIALNGMTEAQFENSLRSFTKREMERMAASKNSQEV